MSKHAITVEKNKSGVSPELFENANHTHLLEGKVDPGSGRVRDCSLDRRPRNSLARAGEQSRTQNGVNTNPKKKSADGDGRASIEATIQTVSRQWCKQFWREKSVKQKNLSVTYPETLRDVIAAEIAA
jgi:hypothetical protein